MLGGSETTAALRHVFMTPVRHFQPVNALERNALMYSSRTIILENLKSNRWLCMAVDMGVTQRCCVPTLSAIRVDGVLLLPTQIQDSNHRKNDHMSHSC